MTDTGTDLDTDGLDAYLEAELGAEVTDFEVLGDGLNLVVAVSTAGGGPAYVLRRPNKLRDAGYTTSLRREYGVMERLDRTPVPAPAPVLFCEDESVLGDRFFLVTHLDGDVVPLGSDPPERFRNPDARREVAEGLVGTLAGVHSLDVGPFEAVCERRTPRDQVARAMDRIEAAARVTGRGFPTLRSVGEWLRRNAPPPSRTTLVHGDFRPGNVLFAGRDRPQVAGVIDWETASLGDPLVDLGYLLLRWRDAGDPTPSLDGLEARYPDSDALGHLRETNERGLAPFTAAPGSPSRRELVARYEAETGTTFENERFYRAQGAFGLATVWVDLHRHRIEAGAESDWEPYIEYVAALAGSIVDGEFGL